MSKTASLITTTSRLQARQHCRIPTGNPFHTYRIPMILNPTPWDSRNVWTQTRGHPAVTAGFPSTQARAGLYFEHRQKNWTLNTASRKQSHPFNVGDQKPGSNRNNKMVCMCYWCNVLKHIRHKMWLDSNNNHIATPNYLTIINTGMNPECLQWKKQQHMQITKKNARSPF